MAEDVATVGIKLKLDDSALAAIEKVRSGFSGLSSTVAGLGSSMAGFAKQAAAIAVGVKFGDILSGVSSIWTDMIKGAKNHNTEVREMANVLAMTSKPGTGWTQLVEQAEKYHHKLREVAIQTGQSKESMVSAFEHIAERSQKPPAEIARIVEQMGVAARMVPTGVEGMVRGFQSLEMGVVRPRNEMVMLIRQAGLMSGSAREISHNLTTMMSPDKLAKASPEVKKLHEEYSKLGREPVMAMAEKAISIMADRAKSIPMTMGQVITSLKESKDQIVEMVGLPILKGMTDAFRPGLEQLRRYLSSHSKDIEAWAKAAGEKAAFYVKLGADKIQQGLEYLKTHSDEIMKALSTGANALMAVLRFLVNNKEIILALAGAKAIAGSGIAKSLGGAAAEAAVSGMALGAKGATGMGGAFAGMGATVGAAAGLAAFAAAIAGVGLAAWQAVKYLDESKGHISPWAALADDSASAIREALAKVAEDSTKEMKKWSGEEEIWYHERAAAAIQAMRDAGATESEIAHANKKIRDDYQAHVVAMGHMATLEKTAQNLLRGTSVEEGMMGPSAMGAGWLGSQQSEQIDMVKQVQAMYDFAAKSNNTAAMSYLTNFIVGNTAVQQALLSAGTTVGLAFDDFAKLLADKAPELAKALSGMGAAGGKMPAAPKVSIGGPSTFNIKQDFRDQDPDRIAIVFQRDLARVAISRTQARSGILG